MHAGFSHIFNNMLVLFFIGDNLERAVGHIRYFIMYIAGGLLANIAALIYYNIADVNVCCVGASGAIFSVVGALFYIVLVNKGQLEDLSASKLGLFIVMSIYLGLQSATTRQQRSYRWTCCRIYTGGIDIQKTEGEQRMNVNIYYGGRGLVDDPTITVLNKITDVLNELRVNVEKYNLFEMKNAITTLPQTLKEADAVILASTVEWFGIGGYMLQFLDACWLYADKSMLEKLYMFPIVMSRASGEKEGRNVTF